MDTIPAGETIHSAPLPDGDLSLPPEEGTSANSGTATAPGSITAAQGEVPAPESRALFRVRLLQKDRTPGGGFVPAAVLEIEPGLRTSGLLRSLPAEDLQSLLLLVTFLTPNGDIVPGVRELASALCVSEGSVRARMRRLEAFLWDGKPLAIKIERESGRDAWTLTPGLIDYCRDEPVPREPDVPLVAAGRDAVIAYSRRTYARPREDVERDIARQMGWEDPSPKTPEERERADLKRRMLLAGVPKEQADYLLSAYSAAVIRRQLDWLPHRHAKAPGRLLVAAIEGGYDAPRSLPLAAALPDDPASEGEAGEGNTDDTGSIPERAAELSESELAAGPATGHPRW